jgi:hypothetical protein
LTAAFLILRLAPLRPADKGIDVELNSPDGKPITGMAQAARLDSVTPCVLTFYDATSGWIEARKKRLLPFGADH